MQARFPFAVLLDSGATPRAPVQGRVLGALPMFLGRSNARPIRHARTWESSCVSPFALALAGAVLAGAASADRSPSSTSRCS